jgi:hypothetical protein
MGALVPRMVLGRPTPDVKVASGFAFPPSNALKQ